MRFRRPPSHPRALLCEYPDSSFLLRCLGTRRKRPLMSARGPPLDRRGGVITIDLRDIPVGVYGLDGATAIFPSLDQYVRFHVRTHFPQPNLFSSDRRPVAKPRKSCVSGCAPLLCPASMWMVILSSSNFSMMCPRLKRSSITTYIPVDEVWKSFIL